MKKTFINIFTVFMAVLVFYGGAGINVISYCCKECRSAGVDALLIDKCCEIHHHNHAKIHDHEHESSKSCCDHIVHAGDLQYTISSQHVEKSLHSEENCCNMGGSCCIPEHAKACHSDKDHTSGECCSMERIDFDWSSQNTTELKINLSPNEYELFSNSIFINSLTLLPDICENNTVMPNGPPIVLPRDYLSVLTVLLI